MKISLTVLSTIVFLSSCVLAGPQQKNKLSAPVNKSASKPAPIRLDGLSKKGQKFRVVSYNIERGEQFSKVQANLEETEADLILLQEVPRKMLRTFSREFAMNYQFGPYTPDGGTGIGILAKGKLEPDKLFSMNDERNFALSVKWTLKGETIFVVCTHLKSLQRPVTTGLLNAMKPHTIQVKQILKQVKKYQLPTIVGGDFNTLAWTPEYRTMAAEMKDVATVAKAQNQPTIFVGGGGYRIDYFFIQGPWNVRDYEVSSKAGSDHRMIQAVLELPFERPLPAGTTERGEPPRRQDATEEKRRKIF